ncbi:hypothetical protein XENORESO_012294 [Xenotaenia resolanae]|uniref:V-SNARE coiled-coil homology domain-containing protein n=1 Tax=Xenotaenia resolanae TaxID=208358 RepID=A0ABV0VLH4_9TELE
MREPEREEQPEDNMPPKFKRHLNDDEVTGSIRSERRNLLEEDSEEEEDFFLRGPTGPRFGPQNDKVKQPCFSLNHLSQTAGEQRRSLLRPSGTQSCFFMLASYLAVCHSGAHVKLDAIITGCRNVVCEKFRLFRFFCICVFMISHVLFSFSSILNSYPRKVSTIQVQYVRGNQDWIRIFRLSVQSQVDEVIDVMQENISKVIERGERLDDLQDKSGPPRWFGFYPQNRLHFSV